MAFPGCLGVQEEEINSQTKLRLGYQYKDTKMWLCQCKHHVKILFTPSHQNGMRNTRKVCCNLLHLWKTLRSTEAHFLTENNIMGILESSQGASLKVIYRRKVPPNLSMSVTGGGIKRQLMRCSLWGILNLADIGSDFFFFFLPLLLILHADVEMALGTSMELMLLPLLFPSIIWGGNQSLLHTLINVIQCIFFFLPGE